MKLDALAMLVAGAASVAASSDIGMTHLGMPIAGVAACFFGAAFSVLFMPLPSPDRRVPPWLAFPTIWGVAVFAGGGMSHVAAETISPVFTHPTVISLVGLVVAACPGPIIRAVARRLGATDV